MGQTQEMSAKGEKAAMGLFGDRLRREREMRGITLDEISESTKISRRHLEALEREQFDQLPGGVFNKGFVRAYARFLGLDEEQAVADYALASNEQPEPEDKFPLEIHEEPDRELNPRRSKLPLIFALAALAGVLVGYFFWVKSNAKSERSATPATQAPAIEASASAASPAPSPETAPATQPASSALLEPPATAPAQEQAVEKKFSVVVKAKEDSWVSVVADGKAFFGPGILTVDSKKKFRATKLLVLTTKNAGGIDVLFNGKPLGALGNENEPRTLTFNATGLVQ
jgi:cytoskeletal protein RodZ